MKTLYLLRHAQTMPAAPPSLGDHERVLSPQGTEEALAVGDFMQAYGMHPDFVLSSSSVRTIQTARLIFGVLFRKAGLKVASHFDRKFYQAPAAKILSEVQRADNSIGQLMVVGHNPGIADLAVTLGKTEARQKLTNYAPATLTVFKADCADWSGFLPASARLERIFVPEINKNSADQYRP